MMRFSFLILAGLAAAPLTAQVVQRDGYVRSDGIYVAPSYATKPNGTKLDNYSTKGNVNPYTGQSGTVDPYKPANPYGSSSNRQKPKYPY